MILSKCAICGSKKSRFIKKQEAKGLLSSLGIKRHSNNIPLNFQCGEMHFECNSIECNSFHCNFIECNLSTCNSVETNFIKKE